MRFGNIGRKERRLRPPPTRAEINNAVAEYIAKGGVITKEESPDLRLDKPFSLRPRTLDWLKSTDDIFGTYVSYKSIRIF